LSADLLKLHGCSEENRALLDVVATSAQRGAALVAQMLSFSRGLDGDRQVVDLASLIKELGRFIDRTFAKNIKLRVDIARDLSRLHANATQIYQVLLNLCVNARDAMPQGGQLTLTARNITLGEITAAALPGGTAGNYVVLSVADTGTGIAKEFVGRIFDPFFTTKSIGAGTGLGLSTVRGIVKACGGVITLSTQVGCGTTFHVYFPVNELAQEVPAGPAVLDNAFGAGEHVLVVDDETSFCDVTRRLLEEFGYVVHVAANGAEAVRIFEEHRAEIAVTVVDLDMPVMDGRTAIKAIRAVDPHARIITASGSIDSTGQLGNEGLEGRLTKPYSMGTLLQTLRQVLVQSSLKNWSAGAGQGEGEAPAAR
jgi:CheY-like chemotaxis protein